MQVTGVVVRTSKKFSKAGNQSYSLLIRDASGTEEWYGFGIKDPGVQEGMAITFEGERNGRWLNGDATTVQVDKTVPKQEQRASDNQMARAVASTSQKDRSIMTQTAYKIAPQVVDSMVAHGLIKFKATNTESGRDTGIELYMGFVHDVAQELFNKFADPLSLTEDKEDDDGSDPYAGS